MVEKYLTTINPLTEKIRAMNYGYYAIETNVENSESTEGDAIEGVAKELAPFGVRVNSIHPGIIDTPMLQTFDEAGEGVREAVRTRIPLGYEAEPIHVARLALYLGSDDSAYSTGSEFVVDGGWSA
ncbi:MAG: SDR family oxidoreductase [Actinobacteria bacterium]|nr:SDR family oxidoreductase [Actinomycetota bacterium]